MKKYLVLFALVLGVKGVVAEDQKQQDTIVVDRSMFEMPQDEYPRSVINRPLTLKQSMFEVNLSPAALVSSENIATIAGTFDAGFKYGISHDIEFGLSANIFAGVTSPVLTMVTEDGYVGSWFNAARASLTYQFFNDGHFRVAGTGAYNYTKVGINIAETILSGKYTLDPLALQLNLGYNKVLADESVGVAVIHPEILLQLGSSFSTGFGIKYTTLLENTDFNSLLVTTSATWSLNKNIDVSVNSAFSPEITTSSSALPMQVGLQLSWRI